MIDPLNRSPGQTEKVPGNKARPKIYIPVHCTGTFLLSKTNLLLKREVRVGAVRAVSTGGSSCGVFQSLLDMGLTSHIACKLLAQNA